MYDFSFIILPENMNEKKGVFKSFMEKNKQITLEQLLKNEDAQDILTRSGYKPAK